MSTVTGTGNIWPNYSKSNVTPGASSDKTMGKDEFMKLLITQLQNQDPMQPMDDKEFIAQMAQFSSVEQIMNMSQQLKALQQTIAMNSDLIGKVVTWTTVDPSDGSSKQMSGTVSALISRDGNQYAKVGDSEVQMDQIESVALPEATQ